MNSLPLPDVTVPFYKVRIATEQNGDRTNIARRRGYLSDISLDSDQLSSRDGLEPSFLNHSE